MSVNIISFDGNTLNDSNVSAFSLTDARSLVRQAKPRIFDVTGRAARFQRSDWRPANYPVELRFIGGSEPCTTTLNRVSGFLEAGRHGDLLVEFNGDPRIVGATVTRFASRTNGPNTASVVFSIEDPRWKSASPAIWNNGGALLEGGGIILDSDRTKDVDPADVTDGQEPKAEGSVGVWRGATNIGTNSSFDTNLNGWTTAGNNILSRVILGGSGITPGGGNGVLQATWANNRNMAFHLPNFGAGYTFQAGKSYMVTALVRILAGWNTGDIKLDHYLLGGETSGFEYVTLPFNDVGNWRQLMVKWDQDITALGGARVSAITDPSGAAGTQLVQVEGFQIYELDSKADGVPGPLILTDGAVVTRTAGTIKVSADGFGSGIQGWAALKIRGGWQDGWTDPLSGQFTLWSRQVGSNDHIALYWQEVSGGRFVLQRTESGVQTAQIKPFAMSRTITALPETVVVCSWTQTTISLAVNGGTILVDVVAPSSLDLDSQDEVELGSRGGGSQLCGDIIWCVGGSGTVNQAQADLIHTEGANDVLPTTFDAEMQQAFAWDAKVTGSSTTQTDFELQQRGNVDEDGPLFTIKPTTVKPQADGHRYARETYIINRSTRALSFYPIALSDFDHAALVTAGKSLASGDDVRIYVDGIEVPRWAGTSGTTDWNQTSTRIWLNLTYSEGHAADLAKATSLSGTEPWEVDPGATAGFPERGHLAVGTEVIYYDGVSDTEFGTREIRRTRWRSVNQAHSPGDLLQFAEHRIQRVYGWTGAPTPDPRDDLEPMILRDASVNNSHVWGSPAAPPGDGLTSTDFPKRSRQWAFVKRATNVLGDSVVGARDFFAAWTVELLTQRPFEIEAGDRPANTLAISTPSGAGVAGFSILNVGFNPALEDQVSTLVYGIDERGNRTLLGSDSPVDELAGSLGVISPVERDGATVIPIVSLEITGQNEIVAGNPRGAPLVASGPGVVNQPSRELQVGDKIVQIFGVPDLRESDTIGEIYGVMVPLAIGQNDTGNFTVTLDIEASIVVEDVDSPGSWIPVNLPVSRQIVWAGVGTSYLWYGFRFGNPATMQPGEILGLQIELVSKVSGTLPTIGLRWAYLQQSYHGGPTVNFFRLYSQQFEWDGLADIPESDRAFYSALIRYDQSTSPGKSTGSPLYSVEYAVIHATGTLTNTTTGQSATLDTVVEPDDVIEIDVENGSVTNTTTQEGAGQLVSLSDPDEWITLEPGSNVMQYVETGATAVEIGAVYHHVYQAG